MITIDKLCYNSGLRYENAGEKFAFAMITLVLCVMSRSMVIAGIVLAVMGILTVWKGRIPLFRYLHFLCIPLVFLLLSTLAIIVNVKKEPLDLFALQLGNWYITGSMQGFLYALQLILTALAAVSCLYFLSMNTPIPDILMVLEKLHCPKLLIELMLLIYRFIFILLDTAYYLSTSQECRLGNRNYRTSLKSFAALCTALMIRAVKRSNALYASMEARCYDGTIRVLTEDHPPRKKIIVLITVFELFLFVLFIQRRFFL